MFIVDFDDTLFDTQAFKEARCRALEKCGVSEDLFWQTYREARMSPEGIFTYSNSRHAEVLVEHGFEEACVLDAFDRVSNVKLMTSFLFKDTVPFLEYLRSHKRPLVLLSLGDPAAQELKVRGSGIHDYFDRVFFVDADKVAVVTELLTSVHEHEAWFINDKVRETKEIAERFPNLHMVLRQPASASAEDYVMSGLPYFKTLTEIQAYVAKHLG